MHALTHDNAAENGTKEQVKMDIRRMILQELSTYRLKSVNLQVAAVKLGPQWR